MAESIRADEDWVVISKPGDYRVLGAEYGVSPMIARVLKNRGIESRDDAAVFLNGTIDGLKGAEYLKDADRLTDILSEKIDSGRKIRIIGDYDIDGVCSAFILCKGLLKAGADADYVIPHRMRDGHGLNERLIREAADQGVDTVLTCDNGISADREIELANKLGLTVLVTDHHAVPFHLEGELKKEELPTAAAVVDPHRSDCQYPYKMLCGAVVAYKVLELLYKKRGIPHGEAEEFLEIAAFATVGDVMPLTGENRILVKEGLKRLENTVNPGLRALIDINDLSGKSLTPYHLGFILGPSINAAGRLRSADLAMELLLSADAGEAGERAAVLKELNESRRDMTEKALNEAVEIVENSGMQGNSILAVYLEDCHESIAGIVAGKLKERFNRPSFILTNGSLSDGSPCLKGSGRSIEAYDMHAALVEIKDLFLQFGGHAMAAGLSLPKEKLSEFRRRLNENSHLTERDLKRKVRLDAELPFRAVDLGLVNEFSLLEPFGTGNEKPLFATRDVQFGGLRVLGAKHNALKGSGRDREGIEREVIYFGDAEAMLGILGDGRPHSIAYMPDRNEYNGEVKLQLVIKNVK